MNVKNEFILREIVGESVLVPVGENASSFNGLITMNEVGTFIWKNISNAEHEDDIVNLVLDEYDIDEENAKIDVYEFINRLREVNIIE